MSYIIGLDFDNTVINYHDVFYNLASELNWISPEVKKTKDAVKNYLIQKDGNDLRWQNLQAQAYGPKIFQASIFSGFREFISEINRFGWKPLIISHKTETSNYDSKISLRESAREWLRSRNLGIPDEDIIFVDSQENKLAAIERSKCSIFIDDLYSLLNRKDFPSNVIRVWLNSADEEIPVGSRNSSILVAKTWEEIQTLLHLPIQLHPKIDDLINRVFNEKISQYEPLNLNGNSRIFKIHLKNSPAIVVKRPLAPSRREFEAIDLLWRNGFENIPRPLYFDFESGLSIYQHIEGKPYSEKQISENHIRQAARFLSDLHSFSHNRKNTFSMEAVSSSKCLQDYLDRINDRLTDIQSGFAKCPYRDEIIPLFENDIFPLQEKIFSKFDRAVELGKLDRNKPFPKTERMLSPSDFGFHNTIIEPNGRVVFLDFEYFGWDDPCKLIADFFHSVAQQIPWELKWQFFDGFFKNIPNPTPLLQRWEIIADLIGFEWILIVLNIVSERVRERKKFANPSIQLENLIKERIQRARGQIQMIQSLRNPGNFLTFPDRLPVSEKRE